MGMVDTNMDWLMLTRGVERQNTTKEWGQDWGWHGRRDVVKVQQKIQVSFWSWDRIRFLEALAALDLVVEQLVLVLSLQQPQS